MMANNKEDNMLETYFVAPKTLKRLRKGPSGPHIDGFASALERDGYSPASAVRYLRAAAHLGHFIKRQGGTLAEIAPTTLVAFQRHLSSCRCPQSNGGRINHHTYFGAKRFRSYLLERGLCQSDWAGEVQNVEPALVVSFRGWLQKHRGAAQPTLRQYCRGAAALLGALGEDPSRWNAQKVRSFLLERAGQCSSSTAQKLITAMRAFLRYLSVQGQCRADLDQAVPAIAHWRLARLPRGLSLEEVDRLLAACEGDSRSRLRDRAMILLLLRLGLRAGDVARLRFTDIDWESGTLRVAGKGRYEVRLPLPQDVGEALFRYLECRAQVSQSNQVFLRNIAPFRPLISGDSVSSVVKRALKRAGVVAPVKGAHLLRHTAATEMLRQGVPLDQIGLVLRHRGIDTTAIYAKADVTLLQQIAQPWPEVLS
jgi:site-specific recombinase XerD